MAAKDGDAQEDQRDGYAGRRVERAHAEERAARSRRSATERSMPSATPPSDSTSALPRTMRDGK